VEKALMTGQSDAVSHANILIKTSCAILQENKTNQKWLVPGLPGRLDK
jgi:hypothetical protein